MAKLFVVYEWNGEPAKYEYPDNLTPEEVQYFVQRVFIDNFLRIPSGEVHLTSKCPRAIYIIPSSKVYRFIVELGPDEECPDPHA